MATEDFILFAEDDSLQRDTIKLACARAGIPTSSYHIVPHGLAAQAYLQTPANPKPTIIISDLKMPFLDGLALFVWVRSHPNFSSLPFVLLTSDLTKENSAFAKRLGCNAFFEKPALPTLIGLLRNINSLAER